MADAYIQVSTDGAGKKVQTFSNTVSANTVHAHGFVLCSSAGAALASPSGNSIPVGGDVDAGSSDSGSPVKVGGVYNATLPTLTDADRGDIQLDSSSRQIVNLGGRKTYNATLFSGTTASSGGTAAQTPVTDLGDYASMTVYAKLAGPTGDTLDAYIQYSPDGGTTWVDYAHFAQQAAAAATNYKTFSVSRGAQQTTITTVGINTTPALAANTVVGGSWGDRLRVVFVSGASTSAGAAVQILAVLTT